MSVNTFDYVIVGAGAAGCVLAHRLSTDPSVTVALLEAGGDDKNPYIHMPKGLAKAMSDPALIWAYGAEPEVGNAFQPEYWARGRLLGGSSAVNGMMYVRGMPADFDEIAAKTSDDWSWKHIGAAYQALEAHELGPGDSRGANGPLRVSMADRHSALTEAMIEAGVAMGLPRKSDTNAPDSGDGIGYATRTIWKGRRQSAATAFLDPIRSRQNLTIMTHALADKVNFEGRRAVSVSIAASQSRPAAVVAARRDIILAGGAMASPGILQRSGIGPAALLGRLNIPVVRDSPQVGQHLLEHRGIIMQWKLNGDLSDNAQYSGWRLPFNVARYYLRHDGPMSSAAYEIGAWFRSSPASPRPDIQFLVTPFSFDFAAQRTKLEPFPGMNIVAYPLRPTSRGEIDIKSTDPHVLPLLKPNYHSTPEDCALMIETVKVARKYAAQAPLRGHIEAETYPGPQCVSDAQIIDAYDRYGSCGYHAVGSCRMGSDPDSVVDPALRVRGVDGLRVMDTSIMPQIPSGNTNGPTMAMAWRAADVITRS
jgi:choline dehydrogenase-like flavoprotein